MRKKYSQVVKEKDSSSLDVVNHTKLNLEPIIVENRLLYATHQHHHNTGHQEISISETNERLNGGETTSTIQQDYYYVDPSSYQQNHQETISLPVHSQPHSQPVQTVPQPPPPPPPPPPPTSDQTASSSSFVTYQSSIQYPPVLCSTITDDPSTGIQSSTAGRESVSAVGGPLESNNSVNQNNSNIKVVKSAINNITNTAPIIGGGVTNTNNPGNSLAMSQLGTVYATKRRRRNGKSLKPPPKDGVTKSNPSKRHRERLNAELDLLASLLPFEQNILSKLDRLSILRLSVSYLRTKSYFQVVMHKDKEENGILSHIHSHDGYRTRELGAFEHGLLDGEMFLQALNGFLMILTCEGEVFFATHSIESYLGFHQSDIVHQSVYELVHSEDREELQRQLLWNSFLPADLSGMPLGEALAPDKSTYLERSFTVRFRCLLDNTSGFLRLDIRGRIKILHGQNRKTEEPPLGLFAYCTPFGPPSLLEIPQKENMFKSKHKLDLSLVSMDQRGKMILGYSDGELVNMGGYDLVHYDDLAYVASAHQELLKTGASGMIAYRYQKKDGEWQWLQTSSRLVYKNSKPDFVICTHRQLMEEEGRDLLGKRTMDFKVSYLDTGLASTYFTEADQLVAAPTGSPTSLPPPVTTPQRTSRRYKTQLRDFLSTCRSKRKLQQTSPIGQVTPPAPVVEYIPDPAAAVAAAYSNLNPMYTTSPYASAADNFLPSVHSTNFYPVTENLFHQYRLQGGYYPEYHHTTAPTSYVTNGFLSYDSYGISPKDDKWQDSSKYYSGTDVTARSVYSGYCSPTSSPQVIQIPLKTPKSSPQIMEVVSCSSGGPSPVNSTSSIAINTTPNHVNTNNTNNNTNTNNNNNSSTNNANANNTANGTNPSIVTPKVEHSPPEHYERQTVLMWGTTSTGNPTTPVTANNSTTRSPNNTPTSNGLQYNESQQQVKLDDQQHLHHHLKWNGKENSVAGVHSYQIHQQQQQQVDSIDHQTVMYTPHHIPSHHHSTTAATTPVHLGVGGGSIEHAGHLHHHQQSPHSDVGIMQGTHQTNNNVSGHHPHHQAQHSQHHHNNQQQHQFQQHHHQQHTTHQQPHQSVLGANSSCEVWNPASYSQFQYFTYHHAPQHASTQSSLGPDNSTNQSHYLSRSNGYMDAHHPAHHHHHHHPHHPSQSHHPHRHHHPGGTISPISPLTQLSHTHPTRTPITRTGVLCCPSLR